MAFSESETRYRQLFEQSPVAIQILKPDGSTLAVNRAWMKLWGVDQAFMDSYFLKEHTMAKDPQLAAKGILPYIQRAFAGETVSVPPVHYDPAELGKAGRDRWTESILYPVKDADGKIQEIVFLHDDITDRVQAERTLKLLAETGTLLATALDYQATLEKIAELAAAHLGGCCVVRGAGGSPIVRPHAPELLSRFPQLLDLVANENQSASFGPLQTPGLRSYLRVPIFNHRQFYGTVLLVSTERLYNEHDLVLAQELARRAAVAIDNAKLYSEAQKAIQLREDFMSIAAHELRTPITPLKMQLQLLTSLLTPELLENMPHGTQILKLIKDSEHQIVRLIRLVGDLLDASRITTGRLTLNIEKVQLSQLVRNAVQRFGPELQKAGCAVDLDIQDSVTGNWDHLRIEQVVVNLLDNAMKYGAGKPIAVSVKKEGKLAKISVQDSGIGIAKEDQARIFERFERAVPVKKFGGLGLGLFITRQIVEAHHGLIRVESAPGQGARFTVELPIAGGDHSPMA